MKTYTVGIIGFGFIGKVHAYAHRTIPLYYPQADFRTRITHIGTSSMETAQKGCDQIQAEVAVADFREITENPDVDVVHICTPNHLHKDMLLSAIKHNKHIYCDKPLTATAAEAAQIKEALAQDPTDMWIYATVEEIFRSRGGTDQALAEVYQQLEAFDPAVAHFAIAMYYANASQHEAAVREFQTVIELDPDHEVADEARWWLSHY